MEGAVTSSDVSKLVDYFEEAEQTTFDARQLSERDRDYVDNKQITEDEERALKKRGQPVVIYNRIQRKVNFLLGLEKQQRKDPKAFPRNPDDEQGASAATDGIRYVCDDQRWDNKRSLAWRNILVEGTGAVFVGVKKTRNGFDPSIAHIKWDRLFYDPKASEYDFADARFMGIVTWYDYDVALAKWPEGEDALSATLSSTSGATYDDKPKYQVWANAKAKRVRVCEIYHREKGVWMRCVFTQGGYLEPSAPSPYIDEEGQPENPIKAISLYLDRDNNRYGDVRILISPQDEINKRRSKGLHLITMRQVRVARASGMDAEKVRKEAAKPDGVFVADKDDFEIMPTADMARGNFEMLQEAKAEIDLLGANAALAGKNENDMSGRAILAQQQGGMVEVAESFDRLRELSLAVYRAIWNRIRQVWTGERWIRITDDERNMKFVGLNQQVTVKQIAQEVQQQKPEGIQSAIKLLGPQVMQAFMQGDPQAQMQIGMFVQQNGDQVAETRNAINELDVDIIIDEGMDTPTVQAEQFDTLTKILPQLFPQGTPPAALEMIIQSSALRDKDKLLELIEQMKAGPSPEQQAQQQLQMRGAEAEVAKTESETAKNYSQAAAADPREQQQLEREKAGHQAMLAEMNQGHSMQMAEDKHGQSLALAARKQQFNEQMAARQAEQKEPA